jgi:tetratricopeptide (TPR) repeat protein
MLSAMVFTARGVLDHAEREAAVGADAQRQHRLDHTPLSPVGLHWLQGLLVGVRGDHAGAIACFEEEITGGATTHIYGREFIANAQVAIGFTQLVAGQLDRAAAAFNNVLREAPGHPRATLGLLAIATRSADRSQIDGAAAAVDGTIERLRSGDRLIELSLIAAGAHAAREQLPQAVAVLDDLLNTAPTGPAGWIIPVDPMLHAVRSAAELKPVLMKLAARAA